MMVVMMRWAVPWIAAFTLILSAATPASAQTETVEYYALDAIGSVRVVFDASGNVVGRMDYDPFGAPLSTAAGLPSRAYAGLFRDGEAGLDHAQARSYQSRTGRFNIVDSIYAGLFDPQQWNRYTYARNAPLTFTDENGLQIKSRSNPGCDTHPLMCDGNGGTGRGDDEGDLEEIPDDVGDRDSGGGDVPVPGPPVPPVPPVPAPPNPPGPNPPGPEPPNPPGPNPPVPNPPGPNPPSPPRSVVSCFASNYKFAFMSTNRFFFKWPTSLARTGIGLFTGGFVARSTRLTSPMMLLKDIAKGEALMIMGARAVTISVGVSVATNTVIVAGGLEAGIIVGSGVDAAIQTFKNPSCR